MSISSFFQFVIGFTLGVSIFVGSVASVGYVFFTKLTATPEKPIFSEEKSNPVNQEPKSTVTEKKEDAPSPQASQSSQSPDTSSDQELELESLPNGAYRAIVTWSDGLSLRAEPSTDADRIGSILYNSKIIVLQDSEDGKWQKIRIPSNQTEGWIKAGNIKKM